MRSSYFFQIEFEFEEVSHKLPNKIWHHFWRSVKDPETTKKYRLSETTKKYDYIYMCKCKFCGKVLKCMTANMRKHLNAYHKSDSSVLWFHHSINSFQEEEFDDDGDLGETELEFEEVSHKLSNNIWRHFYRSSSKEHMRRSMCKYCRKVFKCSTTNLWKHIKAYHEFKLRE